MDERTQLTENLDQRDILDAAQRVLGTQAVIAAADTAHSPTPEQETPGGTVPSLSEQLGRADLPGSFVYVPQETYKNGQYEQEGDPVTRMEEGEGLHGLAAFLRDFAHTVQDSDDPKDQALGGQAADMLQNLNYIGERELAEATASIAASWKEYLDADPENNLYMWAFSSTEGTFFKSSNYLLDRTLSHFNDSELEKYRGRLHFDRELTTPPPPGEEQKPLPEKYKIVMVEDWVVTGRQVSAAYSTEIVRHWNYREPPNVELQLIAATDEQLEHNLTTNDGDYGTIIPIHAYYRIRPMTEGEPCITGVHSSTDDQFELPIADMVQSLRTRHGRPGAVMPPLTNILRPYRMEGYEPANVNRVAKAYGEFAP